MHTLYAYVDGSDLDQIAETLLRKLEIFVRQTRWKTAAPLIVNQRFSSDPTLAPGDLPDWNVGLNLALPPDSPAAIDDAVTIASCLVELRGQLGRDFVLGLHDSRTGTAEDIFSIDSDTLDTDRLRIALG